jgi:hypothetical protein
VDWKWSERSSADSIGQEPAFQSHSRKKRTAEHDSRAQQKLVVAGLIRFAGAFFDTNQPSIFGLANLLF